jgi:predicted ATPase
MTGIGGTGKTTLAQAAAREMMAEFPEGVYFVEMGTTVDPDLAASTIAKSLGVQEVSGKPKLEVLTSHLENKRILLVIDNFEQITDAAPQIAELLTSSLSLKILVTSRNLLHLSAEHEFAVPALTLPIDTSQIPLDELSKYAAIKLFVERARRVKPAFGLTDDNAQSVAHICYRVDCLPLGIELAAAWIKLLTPQSILSKLNNRLMLLTGGATDLPARQQTMRGAIEWSYELLSEEERQLFSDLSVFGGGFTMDAAEGTLAPSSTPKGAAGQAARRYR